MNEEKEKGLQQETTNNGGETNPQKTLSFFFGSIVMVFCFAKRSPVALCFGLFFAFVRGGKEKVRLAHKTPF